MTNTEKTYRPNLAKLFALKSFLVNLYSKLNFSNFQVNKFEQAYNEGVQILLAFTRNYNFSNLIKAGQKFAEAAKLSPANPAPYIQLAWLHFITEDKTSCNEYLEIAERLQPNCPEMLKIKRLMLAC